jgi:hypothetical protein
MLSDECRIEVLSLLQDLDRISRCFFRDEELPKYAEERNSSPDPFQIGSTLAALAEECRRTAVYE